MPGTSQLGPSDQKMPTLAIKDSVPRRLDLCEACCGRHFSDEFSFQEMIEPQLSVLEAMSPSEGLDLEKRSKAHPLDVEIRCF